MKTLKTHLTLLLIVFGAMQVMGQSYPTDPTVSEIAADMRNDEVTKQVLESYGYDPAILDRGTIRKAKKSELKDYFYSEWYWRSDEAYKISLNKNYQDMRSFSMFLETSKDSKGISHKVFFKVTYTRRNANDFEDNKWNYYSVMLDPIECETYGLPTFTDAQRKKMMMDYILKNRSTDEVLTNPQHPVNNLIKIDSIHAHSHSYTHYKPLSAQKYFWTLSILGEISVDKTSEGGVERVSREYISIPFEATYNNGSYELNPLGMGWLNNYIDTDAPGRDKLYNAGQLETTELEDPVWYETLATKSFDELMQKKYTNDQPAGSEAYINKRMEEISKALQTISSGDKQAMMKALKPVMNPAKAEELAQSYIDLSNSFISKACTLEVTRTQGSIPYSYELGDAEGPYIEFYMSIKREAARTKELKQAYKDAGMSSQVLKSTNRGSEYGMLSNKSYDQEFKLVLINGEWYIDEAAEPDQVKIAF